MSEREVMANQVSPAELLAVDCGDVGYKGGVWSFYWGNSPVSEVIWQNYYLENILKHVIKTGSICEGVGIGKCGRPSKWKWVACVCCVGETEGVRGGGSMNKVGCSVVPFCVGCNRDKVEAGEILEDTKTTESFVWWCAGEGLGCLVVNS